MRAAVFWKTVTMDRSWFLEDVIAVLDNHAIRYCVVGGQAVKTCKARCGPQAIPLVSPDIARLLEVAPHLRSLTPPEIRSKLN